MYMGCVVMCYEAMLVRSCLVYGNFFNDLLTYIECSACVCVIILCLRCTSTGDKVPLSMRESPTRCMRA